METTYHALDYYNLDELLTEDERMVRDLVRQWVDREVIPIIGRYADEGKFPNHLIPQMAGMGLFGPTLPETYGGAGATEAAYGLMMQELERGDSGLRSFASVQSALVMYPIYRYGSEEQRRKYLPKLARGELIGCFGLTEPNFGSDPGGMITRAERDGEGFILNGAKMWITNGTVCDLAVVWAKLDGVVRGFIVEMGTPGFTAPETKMKWSLRASVTSELVFEDVRLPSEALLPNGEGLSLPLSCLTQARYGIAWGTIGAAMACYDEARRYALSRIQFGKPIASFQMVQEKLAIMATEITKAQLLNFRLAQLKQSGKATHQMVSMAKRNGCFQALKIARMARDILGAAGITYEFQSGRHMVNIESVYTYEGTHDIHTLVIGADLTGIEAFR
ncbi:MAG: acyl-CoA dehydrogenase [Calditrichaeota bacterium]|nr:acyl-CoA dehydrogenase [Calditrichota bacterium]